MVGTLIRGHVPAGRAACSAGACAHCLLDPISTTAKIVPRGGIILAVQEALQFLKRGRPDMDVEKFYARKLRLVEHNA